MPAFQMRCLFCEQMHPVCKIFPAPAYSFFSEDLSHKLYSCASLHFSPARPFSYWSASDMMPVHDNPYVEQPFSHSALVSSVGYKSLEGFPSAKQESHSSHPSPTHRRPPCCSRPPLSLCRFCRSRSLSLRVTAMDQHLLPALLPAHLLLPALHRRRQTRVKSS